MLGKKIIEMCNYEFMLLTRENCDLTDFDKLKNFLDSIKNLDGIWHVAAYTNVENAEENKEECFKVNWISTKILSDFAIKRNLRILYISTDYVFDGKKKSPYREWDETNPLNTYGKSKLFGEKEVLRNPFGLVIRTSWLYGEYKENFVTKVLEKAKREKKLRVVCDQCGSPTYTRDLVNIIKLLWENEETGIYHFSNKGEITWFEFAKEILKIKKIECEIEPILSEELNLKAKRPFYSVLDTYLIENKFGYRVPSWKVSLKDYLEKII